MAEAGERVSTAAGALSGLVVADFSRVLSGPLATMVLSDLGATVIKVEQPEFGDLTRSWGPPFYEGDSTYYLGLNRGKQSIELDLGSAEDRDVACELARRADVLVENFRPNSMEEFGLGYDRLSRDNPGLIYCSISGFGRGPGAELPGFDFLAQALGGLMSITGPVEGEPTKVGVAVVDVITGLFADVGILAALSYRGRTGLGQRVDLSLLGSTLAALINQGSAFVLADAVAGRMGNQHPSVVPYETLHARDRPLVLAIGTDRQFADLCACLGQAGLARDQRFATNAARVQNRDLLRQYLESSLRQKPADTWVAQLQAAGLPCGQVNDLREAFALASKLGLNPVQTTTAGDGRSIDQTANPLGLSRSPVSYTAAPPRLGEHSASIRAWLGF